MNWRYLMAFTAVLAGAASGSVSLESAAASQPPITWGSLGLLSVGPLVALPLVLGFQAVLEFTSQPAAGHPANDDR